MWSYPYRARNYRTTNSNRWRPATTETTTTPDRTVLTGKILSQAAFTATIDAPIGKIDIADWLRTLPDSEYQRCAPPDHKAAGYTTTDDGRPMSPRRGDAVGPFGLIIIVGGQRMSTCCPRDFRPSPAPTATQSAPGEPAAGRS
jgi:hypothetical protein